VAAAELERDQGVDEVRRRMQHGGAHAGDDGRRRVQVLAQALVERGALRRARQPVVRRSGDQLERRRRLRLPRLGDDPGVQARVALRQDGVVAAIR
jgi:hypothetical protein